MIVDFAVSQQGDLLFHKQDKSNTRFKASFVISKTKALKVIMDFNGFENNFDDSSNKFKASFDIDHKIYDKSANIIKEEDALTQLLMLQLKTSLGEIPNRSKVGSKLSLMRHAEIDKSNLLKIKSYVLEAIKDNIPNAIVDVYVEINNSENYREDIAVKIYNKDQLLLKYIM